MERDGSTGITIAIIIVVIIVVFWLLYNGKVFENPPPSAIPKTENKPVQSAPSDDSSSNGK